MCKIFEYEKIKTLKIKPNCNETFLAYKNTTKEKVIVKQYYSINQYSKISFQRDKNININHFLINKLIEYFENENSLFVVRQFIEGQNINELAKKIKSKNKIDFVLNFIRKVGECLKILHNNGIIHRDIRPSNIICDKSDNFVLIDFSSSLVPKLDNIDTYKTFSLIYSPPEQVLNYKHLINESSDIYALGISSWILLTDNIPFKHKIPELIANLQLNLPLPKIKKIPSNLQNIIDKCTYKIPFNKPPKFCNYEQIEQLIINGQQNRYPNVDELLDDIKKL